MSYPWFFQYKELAHPSQEFERPPITSSPNRIDRIREAATPAPALPAARPIARPRQRLPPSPSPSDHSSSSSSSSAFSSSPSPSPSSSPSPSPPPVASLLRMSLTPRPNLAPQQSSNNAVVTAGPRPHTRPNAIASTSRIPIPIKVEASSSSSSSASPASEIHMWGQSDSDSAGDSDSEHEMENDLVKSEPRSATPPRHGTDLAGAMVGKRYRPDHRPDLEERPPKRGRPALETRSEPTGSDETRPTSIYRRPPQPSQVPAIALAHANDSTDASTRSTSPIVFPLSHALVLPEEGQFDEHDDRTTLAQLDCQDESLQAKKDRFMLGLRVATGPEDLFTALETIHPRHYRMRRNFQQAITDDAKLEVLSLHRACSFEYLIHQMRQNQCVSSRGGILIHSLLPQCLTDCRLFVDRVEIDSFRCWGRLATKAGA